MCKVADYPDLYLKAGGILREEGINPSVPGYEMLRRAVVVYKIEGGGPNFFQEVKNGLVIPTSKVKKRSAEQQWMIEALKIKNIDMPLMEYIESLAKKL